MPDIDEIIFTTAMAEGMPGLLASLIVAQAKHETGNYTSNVFRTDKNLFGYSWVQGSPYQAGKGLAKPEGGYYARYDSYADSVREITAWIRRRQGEGKFPDSLDEIRTPQIYAQLLKGAGYFTDALINYTNGLVRYFDPVGINWWALLGVALAGYAFIKYVLPKFKFYV